MGLTWTPSQISNLLQTVEIKNNLDSVSATASDAKTTADGVASTASDAKAVAESAQATASDAKTTADGAKTTADGAKTTADGAQATAVTAQATASGAQATADGAQATAVTAQATADGAQATITQTASDTLSLKQQTQQIIGDDVFHAGIVGEFVSQEAFTALPNIGTSKIPKHAIWSNVTWNTAYRSIFKDPLAPDPATATPMYNMYFKTPGDDPVFTGFDFADGISVHYMQDTKKGTFGALRIQMHKSTVNSDTNQVFMDWKNTEHVIAQFYGMRYGKTKKKRTDGETGKHITSIVGWACSKYPYFLEYHMKTSPFDLTSYTQPENIYSQTTGLYFMNFCIDTAHAKQDGTPVAPKFHYKLYLRSDEQILLNKSLTVVDHLVDDITNKHKPVTANYDDNGNFTNLSYERLNPDTLASETVAIRPDVVPESTWSVRSNNTIAVFPDIVIDSDGDFVDPTSINHPTGNGPTTTQLKEEGYLSQQGLHYSCFNEAVQIDSEGNLLYVFLHYGEYENYMNADGSYKTVPGTSVSYSHRNSPYPTTDLELVLYDSGEFTHNLEQNASFDDVAADL